MTEIAFFFNARNSLNRKHLPNLTLLMTKPFSPPFKRQPLMLLIYLFLGQKFLWISLIFGILAVFFYPLSYQANSAWWLAPVRVSIWSKRNQRPSPHLTKTIFDHMAQWRWWHKDRPVIVRKIHLRERITLFHRSCSGLQPKPWIYSLSELAASHGFYINWTEEVGMLQGDAWLKGIAFMAVGKGRCCPMPFISAWRTSFSIS